MKYTLYVGGYGAHSIVRMAFEEGTLTEQERTEALNASYLCLSADRKRLYAVSETLSNPDGDGGRVSVYEIGQDGGLTLFSSQPSNGRDPCHLALIGGQLIVSNYNSGSFTRFPILPDGGIGEAIETVSHAYMAPERTAHVHQALPIPDGRFAVTDLGLDRVCFYGGTGQPDCARVPNGFGPRHMCFPNGSDTWYVLCELKGQLLAYRGFGSAAALRARYPIGGTEHAAAALRLSPDGRTLLATGRGQHLLALYSVGEDGLLGHLQDIDTMGVWPRDAAFSPDGKYILCANERSSTVTVFAFDGRRAEYVAGVNTRCPTCIMFA